MTKKTKQKRYVEQKTRQKSTSTRKPLRGDDQRDDHLDAIPALVPAIAKAALVFVIARGLIDYMEFHVIGNDSILKRLTVA